MALVLVVAASSCSSPDRRGVVANGTTTISIVGPEGSHVSGSCVQNGQRVPVAGVLPLVLTREGLSEFEILKESPDQRLSLAAQHDICGWHSEAISAADEGVSGFRVRIDRGVTIEKLER